MNNIPEDLKAVALEEFLENVKHSYVFNGLHHRNVFKDINSSAENDDSLIINLGRPSLYDILPEAFFHQIDRFEHISPQNYKEDLKEEIELQATEETNARNYFYFFDNFIFKLESYIYKLQQELFSDNSVITDMICDNMSSELKTNRFVKQALQFVPICSEIRGNLALILFIIKKILKNEGIKYKIKNLSKLATDISPRYSNTLNEEATIENGIYLDSSYIEIEEDIQIEFWDYEECDETFPSFVKEIREFENFLNDFFMGIGTQIKFTLIEKTENIRLSDSLCYNYLNYNTNL